MGFADLVPRADRNQGLRNQIVEALGEVQLATAPLLLTGEIDLKAQNFSDSLILSAKVSPVGIWHLTGSINNLAEKLLQLGVLVRGGVTIGEMHHDKHIVFGIGVNDAYRLESTVTRLPRIRKTRD